MKWSKGALLLFVALLLLCCGACAETPAQESIAEPTPTPAPTPSGVYRDGVYTATAQGYAGPVIVKVTFAEDSIISVEISGDMETRGVGTVAMERLPERIMGAQSSFFDGVSGATETSEAVRKAVRDVIKQAAYPEESPTPAPTAEQPES